jgi:hypothetical protein
VTNLTISDTLPAGVTYVSGGLLVGDTVIWSEPVLGGYGAATTVTYVVSSSETVSSDGYTAAADGGYTASGATIVVTKRVDAQAWLTAVADGELAYGDAGVTTAMALPAGSFFADTTLAYRELVAPEYAATPGLRFAGRAFSLEAYQENNLAADLRFGEQIEIVVTYHSAAVAGLDESRLRLLYWDGAAWTTEGAACQVDTVENQLTCLFMTPPATGQFALFEASQLIYLPLVMSPAN